MTMLRMTSGAVALLALLAAGSAAVWLLAVPSLAPVHTFAGALVAVAVVTLAAGWGWLVVTTTAYAVSRLRSFERQAPRGCPWLARAVVAALLGVGGTALPAHADPGGATMPGAGVAGLRLPDRVVGIGQVRHEATAGGRVVEVRPGESLWSIARAALPPDATAATITRAWHRIYAANQARIGADPDLILPGTSLRLPHLGSERKDIR